MSAVRGGEFSVVEICAGAGGQALGLEKAGFEHELAVELDADACRTLRANRDWHVREGDVADPTVWNPADYGDIDLLAGGVPCPPFSVAGKQLGALDERDLFSWAIEVTGRIKPRALLLENVRGLSTPRFAGYRTRVIERLEEFGYTASWQLLQASDYGVPQLRPRFVLVALRPEDAGFFAWPEPTDEVPSVGTSLRDLMAMHGWKHADAWAKLANGIAPTIVGGSKKHGGADLGPTRAKAAWQKLAVDGKGIADDAPRKNSAHPRNSLPRLTNEMVSRVQGWAEGEWEFTGRKTATYRQIGNAFPPPVAEAVGTSIFNALAHMGEGVPRGDLAAVDDLYQYLRDNRRAVRHSEILKDLPELDDLALKRRISALSMDFAIDELTVRGEPAYRLGEFKGFVGQDDHIRHAYMDEHRSKVS